MSEGSRTCHCCSVTKACLTLCDPTDCSMPGLPVPIFWSSPKFVLIELVMLSNHLILCHPLLLLPSIFPSIRVFSNESAFPFGGQSIGASASASVLPKSILFRIDWFDFLAFQGTLKSLHQHRSLKASILQHSAFFMVQLSHPYMANGKD